MFVAAYERLPDLYDLFEGLGCGRVAIGNSIEKRSGSGRVDLDNRLNRDHLDREAIGYGSNRGRVGRVLIGNFFFYPDQTRSLHDRFSINSIATQAIPDHFPMASRALILGLVSLLCFFVLLIVHCSEDRLLTN